MKLALNHPSKKDLFFLSLFLILSATTWFLGPQLFVANQFPLADPQKRIVLILTFALAFVTRLLLTKPASFKNASPNQAQLQQLLRGRFLGAVRFLKKTLIDKHGYSTPLNKLPWYLLIGPPGSGKTTLLAYSGINFILSKQYKQEGHEKNIAASTVCDWWVTRDLVLVDVPGCYGFSTPQEISADALSAEKEEPIAKPIAYLGLWKNLLGLLTKYRQKNNIGAIIIALHLPEMIKQERQQQTLWFQEMKERLTDAWAKFGKLPVYFIITKSDLMPGFCEFFNDSGSDELTQPWGIPLSGLKAHENLLDVFQLRFNALIKRLNKQLIWRLHQERDADARPSIKEFPLQLEFIKETLTHLIKMLQTVNPNLDIEGIYLTSATQGNPTTSDNALFHHDVPTKTQTLSPSPFVSRVYFVKNIISYLLPHTSNHIIQRFRQKAVWLPKAFYGASFAALLVLVLWLGKDFQKGLFQISIIQHDLGQYQLYLQQNNLQNASLTEIASALPLLNTLKASVRSSHYQNRFEQLKYFYSQQSQKTSTAVYQRALENIVLPPLRTEFEKYLQTTENKNPDQIYLALKAYLMLRDQPSTGYNEADHRFFAHVLRQVAPELKPEFFTSKMMEHIQNALEIKHNASLDNKLIQQTRRFLNSLPPTDLAYVLLKGMRENSHTVEINLGTNIGTPPALVSKGTATLIPQMFTASQFEEVLKTEILTAAEETLSGNAVLGKKSLSPDALVPLSASTASLAEELQKKYITHYIDIWESLVDNISLNTPHNLAEVDAMILNLISSHSPLLQLLETIHANTQFQPILSSSFKLDALNTLFNQAQTKEKDSLYEIFVSLHELHTQLTQTQQNQAASQQVVSRIHDMTEGYPEPIKNWLQTLSTLTQNHLQEDASSISLKTPALLEPQSSLKNSASPLSMKQTPILNNQNLPTPISTETTPPHEPGLTRLHYQLTEDNDAKKEIIKEDTRKAKKLALSKKKTTIFVQKL